MVPGGRIPVQFVERLPVNVKQVLSISYRYFGQTITGGFFRATHPHHLVRRSQVFQMLEHFLTLGLRKDVMTVLEKYIVWFGYLEA